LEARQYHELYELGRQVIQTRLLNLPELVWQLGRMEQPLFKVSPEVQRMEIAYVLAEARLRKRGETVAPNAIRREMRELLGWIIVVPEDAVATNPEAEARS